MAESVEVRQLDSEEIRGHFAADDSAALPDGMLVYTIEGPFFFGAIEQFEAALVHTNTEPEVLVLNLSRVPFIDLSGLASLREAIETLDKRQVEVVLCCARPDVMAKLSRDGLGVGLLTPATATLAEVLSAWTAAHPESDG